MRFLAVLFILFMTPLSGTAGALTDIPPGFYDSKTTSSIDACSEFCLTDGRCKGYAFTSSPPGEDIYMCYVYNGQEQGSLFEFPPPEPLDLNLALSDLNNYRMNNGLQPVTLNNKLISSSKKHAYDMANNGMVEHVGTDGSKFTERMESFGYNYTTSGENIAGGQSAWPTVFADWQESPGHNSTLLMPDATEFGIALVYDSSTRYNYYWAMLMAAPIPN